MAAAKFRYIGSHAQDLDDGTMIAPGDSVSLTKDEQSLPVAVQLMADGVLIPTGPASGAAVEAAEKEVARNE